MVSPSTAKASEKKQKQEEEDIETGRRLRESGGETAKTDKPGKDGKDGDTAKDRHDFDPSPEARKAQRLENAAREEAEKRRKH